MVKGERILITGGAGFIGSYLAERLVADNQIVVYDNLRRNGLKYTQLLGHKNLKLVKGDVLDENSLKKAIKGCEIVIHLAAIAGVSSYYKNPLKTLEVDAWGTYNTLKLSAELGVKQVILTSSSEVYGPEAKQVTEESLTAQGPATDSRWSYGVGKLVGDHFGLAFAKMTELKVTIVRPFNIYGPRQVGEGAIQIFVPLALEGKPLEIKGNGDQVRAWCYVDDCVDGILKTMANPKAYNQIFNLGNPDEPVTVKELAERIIKLAQSKSKLKFIPQPFAEIIYRSPDIQKAKQRLNYKPQVSLNQGLKRTIDWFRGNDER